jgi:competence protein ComEC
MRKVFSVILVLTALLLGAGRAGCQDAALDAATAGRADRSAQVLGQAPERGKLTGYFFKLTLAQDSSTDEKSGDSALLVSPEGQTMLIDSGSPDCYSQVSGYLETLGIRRLDYVVATHPHIDHIGSMAEILARFSVGRLYMSRLVYPTSIYAGLMSAAKRLNVPVSYLQEGSVLSFGDSVAVKVLNPEPEIIYYEGYPANSTQFINNHSLVLRFGFGAATMLFMGDLYSSGEAELMQKYGPELKADLVKAGHHGSDTSSSKSFIKAVSPKIVVMTHDRLASLAVYKNYRKAQAAVYLTALDGCVKVSVDSGGSWSTVTQFDRLSDFLN